MVRLVMIYVSRDKGALSGTPRREGKESLLAGERNGINPAHDHKTFSRRDKRNRLSNVECNLQGIKLSDERSNNF